MTLYLARTLVQAPAAGLDDPMAVVPRQFVARLHAPLNRPPTPGNRTTGLPGQPVTPTS